MNENGSNGNRSSQQCLRAAAAAREADDATLDGTSVVSETTKRLISELYRPSSR
ncbi:hypothetical protein OH492_10715 [Vibrio chagasii]|nr:hypothetical protein [Vibrio chagasii]